MTVLKGAFDLYDTCYGIVRLILEDTGFEGSQNCEFGVIEVTRHNQGSNGGVGRSGHLPVENEFDKTEVAFVDFNQVGDFLLGLIEILGSNASPLGDIPFGGGKHECVGHFQTVIVDILAHGLEGVLSGIPGQSGNQGDKARPGVGGGDDGDDTV